MPSPALLIGLGFIVVATAISVVFWPLLRDDMARSVGVNDNKPDVTSMALLALGSGILTGILTGIPAVVLWLGVTA